MLGDETGSKLSLKVDYTEVATGTTPNLKIREDDNIETLATKVQDKAPQVLLGLVANMFRLDECVLLNGQSLSEYRDALQDEIAERLQVQGAEQGRIFDAQVQAREEQIQTMGKTIRKMESQKAEEIGKLNEAERKLAEKEEELKLVFEERDRQIKAAVDERDRFQTELQTLQEAAGAGDADVEARVASAVEAAKQQKDKEFAAQAEQAAQGAQAAAQAAQAKIAALTAEKARVTEVAQAAESQIAQLTTEKGEAEAKVKTAQEKAAAQITTLTNEHKAAMSLQLQQDGDMVESLRTEIESLQQRILQLHAEAGAAAAGSAAAPTSVTTPTSAAADAAAAAAAAASAAASAAAEAAMQEEEAERQREKADRERAEAAKAQAAPAAPAAAAPPASAAAPAAAAAAFTDQGDSKNDDAAAAGVTFGFVETKEEESTVNGMFATLDENLKKEDKKTMYWDPDGMSFTTPEGKVYNAKYYVAKNANNDILAALIANHHNDDKNNVDDDTLYEVFYLANFSSYEVFEGDRVPGLAKQLIKKFIGECPSSIKTFVLAAANLSLAIMYAGWAKEIDRLEMGNPPGVQLNKNTIDPDMELEDEKGETLLKRAIGTALPKKDIDNMFTYLFTHVDGKPVSQDTIKKKFLDKFLTALDVTPSGKKPDVIKAIQLRLYEKAYEIRKAGVVPSSSMGGGGDGQSKSGAPTPTAAAAASAASTASAASAASAAQNDAIGTHPNANSEDHTNVKMKGEDRLLRLYQLTKDGKKWKLQVWNGERWIRYKNYAGYEFDKITIVKKEH